MLRVRTFCLLCVLCGSVASCFALDREAFTFTSYDLKVRVEPEQHRLGVRGTIVLRNDTQSPQKIAVLQISSSLEWRSIKAGGEAVQFVTQTYTSDIDHTGELSEAIVTLPRPVSPMGTVELEVAYEGVILLDATRLTGIGTPEATATSSDWDQISPKFTAVRGVGYVAWYPIATESVDLAEPNGISSTVGRWQMRQADSKMSFLFESTQDSTILFSGNTDGFVVQPEEGIARVGAFSMVRVGMNVPTFVVANFKKVDVRGMHTVDALPGKEAAAGSLADLLANLDPYPGARGPRRLQVVGLPDPDAASFVTESMLLMPMSPTVTQENRLTLIYALARQECPSPRPWIAEGLAHLAQVLDIEHQNGRKAALDYLKAHRLMLADPEKEIAPANASARREDENSAVDHSLINAADDAYTQSKAMWVWWMIHDMVGDLAPSMVLLRYNALDDKEPSYMQKLLEKPTHRDLEWFFDDWVYRDRGLPDFKVESAFARKTMNGEYMLTITVANLGGAGAEVPLTVKFAGGEIGRRLEVRAKSNAVIRVETPSAPLEIVLNDGSVPESDLTNNTFKIEAEAK